MNNETKAAWRLVRPATRDTITCTSSTHRYSCPCYGWLVVVVDAVTIVIVMPMCILSLWHITYPFGWLLAWLDGTPSIWYCVCECVHLRVCENVHPFVNMSYCRSPTASKHCLSDGTQIVMANTEAAASAPPLSHWYFLRAAAKSIIS